MKRKVSFTFILLAIMLSACSSSGGSKGGLHQSVNTHDEAVGPPPNNGGGDTVGGDSGGGDDNGGEDDGGGDGSDPLSPISGLLDTDGIAEILDGANANSLRPLTDNLGATLDQPLESLLLSVNDMLAGYQIGLLSLNGITDMLLPQAEQLLQPLEKVLSLGFLSPNQGALQSTDVIKLASLRNLPGLSIFGEASNLDGDLTPVTTTVTGLTNTLNFGNVLPTNGGSNLLGGVNNVFALLPLYQPPVAQ